MFIYDENAIGKYYINVYTSTPESYPNAIYVLDNKMFDNMEDAITYMVSVVNEIDYKEDNTIENGWIGYDMVRIEKIKKNPFLYSSLTYKSS